jgi:hypothetical protein
MAAGAFLPYQSFVYRTARGDIAWLTDTIKALLATSTYTPNAATHTTLSDITNECADSGYARQTLGSKTITLDGSGRTVWGAAGLDFGNTVTIAGRYVVLFKDTGTAGTSYLCGYVDLNNGGSGNVSSVNSDFDLAWNASGIYRITP